MPLTVGLSTAPDREWQELFRYGDHRLPVDVSPILTKAQHPVFVWVKNGNHTMVGIGRGAINGQWLGISALEVSPGIAARESASG